MDKEISKEDIEKLGKAKVYENAVTVRRNNTISKNNKVRTTENKISRTIVGRTVTMGSGRQQGSIGSRPEGNKAFINNSGTRIGRAEIRASARFRQNP